MKKLFLLTLGLLITLTACEFVPISEPSSSFEQPTSGNISSTSDGTTSGVSNTSIISSEDGATSFPITSGSNSTSEPSLSSEIHDIDTPPNSPFIDENYATSFLYNPASYDVVETIPTTNPYAAIDTKAERTSFHNPSSFVRATSYEDAMYRTEHYLISGDIKDTPLDANFDINHLPNRQYRDLAKYRIDEGVYEYDNEGGFKSYTINNLEGKVKKVFYGAAYVTLEDVAAYVFAFADAPSNWSSSKSGSIGNWGIYKRFNNSYFSANTDEYQFEPDVPRTDFSGRYSGEGIYKYYEMDFGYTETGWDLGYSTYSKPYNNGSSITRGPVRLVYTAADTSDNRGAKYIPMDHRHVFLTYNHYNDFIEYLNYENGWGIPFGWMSAGNEYCSGMSSGSSFGKGYYEFDNPNPKTTYDDYMVYRITKNDGLALINYLNA